MQRELSVSIAKASVIMFDINVVRVRDMELWRFG
jgi:hypothetical protein